MARDPSLLLEIARLETELARLTLQLSSLRSRVEADQGEALQPRLTQPMFARTEAIADPDRSGPIRSDSTQLPAVAPPAAPRSIVPSRNPRSETRVTARSDSDAPKSSDRPSAGRYEILERDPLRRRGGNA